jgi:hypothetical protein
MKRGMDVQKGSRAGLSLFHNISCKQSGFIGQADFCARSAPTFPFSVLHHLPLFTSYGERILMGLVKAHIWYHWSQCVWAFFAL